MYRLCAIAIVVGGCSKKASDDCVRVVEKSSKVLGEIAAMRNVKFGDKEREQVTAQCREAVKAGRKDPQMACVLAAKDDAGVRDCYMKGFEQYVERSKTSEAKIQLSHIGKSAKAYAETTGAFMKGKVGPTPATPCCSEQSKQCVADDKTWADPV